MSAYAMFDNVEVHDPRGLADYKERVQEVVARYGGRYVVLGGEVDLVEGDWRPTFPVMIEFPDIDAARAWYDSPEYAALKALRQASARANGVLIAGL